MAWRTRTVTSTAAEAKQKEGGGTAVRARGAPCPGGAQATRPSPRSSSVPECMWVGQGGPYATGESKPLGRTGPQNAQMCPWGHVCHGALLLWPSGHHCKAHIPGGLERKPAEFRLVCRGHAEVCKGIRVTALEGQPASCNSHPSEPPFLHQ